ncbi:MAG: radical SAM protein [Myxococcota bacterium]
MATKKKILFLRPPRYLWSIMNATNYFVLPLAYPTLAGYLRRKLPELEIHIVDTNLKNLGWNSVAKLISDLKPDFVAVGEKTMYYDEGFRAFTLAKNLNPNVVTIGGGVMYSALPKWSLNECKSLDYIVAYEGEETLCELIETLIGGGDVANVRGIAYRNSDGEPQITPPRPLIEDLDSLPFPAYDLMNVPAYKTFGEKWPISTTIQSARGCLSNCNFCSWRIQEGRPALFNGKYKSYPAFRRKSVGRAIEEVEYLYRNFGVRYLFWVDASFNLDNEWVVNFSEELLRKNLKIQYLASVRSDYLLEQERLGILELMVKSGLRHVIVGVERSTESDLSWLNKRLAGNMDTSLEIFRVMAKKYPEVLRQGIYLCGLPDDDAKKIEALVAHAHTCNLDIATFHPLTPFPGTPLYEDSIANGSIEERDFTKYDLFHPIMRTKYLTREEVGHLTHRNHRLFLLKKPWRFPLGLASPHFVRREMLRWAVEVMAKSVFKEASESIRNGSFKLTSESINMIKKPAWYES